jgi:hypothetical protein
MAGYIEHPGRRRNVMKKKVKAKKITGHAVAKGELTKVQVAERLGVSTKTLENWVKAKEVLLAKKNKTPADLRALDDMVPLPVRRSARHIRWRERDVDLYQARNSA